MTKPTQDKVVEAVARAFHSMVKLADTDEKRRELMLLTEMTYLQLHALFPRIGEEFYRLMAPGKDGATTDERQPEYIDDL